MDEAALRRLLKRVASGATPLDEAVARLRAAPFERLGDLATLDTHRALRQGMPEVVLAEGKTAAQVAAIARRLAAHGPLLVTRLSPEKAGAVQAGRQGGHLRPGLADAAPRPDGAPHHRAGGGLLRRHQRRAGLRGGGGHARR